eukprot:3239456-Pleurochrysis_carterae.AAC.1
MWRSGPDSGIWIAAESLRVPTVYVRPLLEGFRLHDVLISTRCGLALAVLALSNLAADLAVDLPVLLAVLLAPSLAVHSDGDH